MDTHLSLYDTKGKGKDCLSKHSKLTGDFCLLHEMMDTTTMTGATIRTEDSTYESGFIPLFAVDQIPGCDYSPIDDVKHLYKCFQKLGMKKKGTTIDENVCMDTRPSIKYCVGQ